MMTQPVFAPDSPADIVRLVAAHPFALMISSATGTPIATPLPLLAERETDGAITLLGHIARASPHTQLLRRHSRALVVFQGAHGYISPSWL
ncbi:MAG: FMN-binding negative transcriptional regulator, partial [Solimonas sp.]